MNTRTKNILYIVVPIILAVWLLGYEFIWRFDSKLDLLRSIPIITHSGVKRTLYIHQQSNSSVDTIRRVFSEVKNGKTYCSLWLDGSTDTLHTEATGRYFSEFRPVRLATDTSVQVILIPNTEHGLPTGWGEMVYLTPDDSLHVIQLINSNIADLDNDGRLELYDRSQQSWAKLDLLTRQWVAVPVKKSQQ